MGTEMQLIEVCREIGGVAGCNGMFTAGLMRRIEDTGKSVDELTVGELCFFIREYQDFYNHIYGGNS